MKTKQKSKSKTVTVDRDAMIALLSTAYRSCRQLKQIVAASYVPGENAPHLDRGWLYEIALLLNQQGGDALIEAGDMLGFDDSEDQLARFDDEDQQDDDAAAALSLRVVQTVRSVRQ